MKYNFDVIIIGGGAVGCAIAYQLSSYEMNVSLLERAPDVCLGTSGKNSGVVHAGFNNRPGSLMAELCVKGNKQFESIYNYDCSFANCLLIAACHLFICSQRISGFTKRINMVSFKQKYCFNLKQQPECINRCRHTNGYNYSLICFYPSNHSKNV